MAQMGTIQGAAGAAPLEPGLPFVGALLWPVMQHRKLNKLVWWQVNNSRLAAAPNGSIVGLKPVRRMRDITPGLYVVVYRFEAASISPCVFQVGQYARRGRSWVEGYHGGEDTNAITVMWERIDLYRIECYASIGNGTYVPAPKQRKRKQSKSAKQEQLVWETGACRVTFKYPGKAEQTTFVPMAGVGLLHRAIGFACQDEVGRLEKRIKRKEAKRDALVSSKLLAEVQHILRGKGGPQK